MADLPAHAERLRALLLADELLVLANVWDVASARLVAGLGHPALATASAAITGSLGHPDDDTIPPTRCSRGRREPGLVPVTRTRRLRSRARSATVHLLGAGASG